MEGVRSKRAVSPQARIHTLVLPLNAYSLLLPSALIAEVVNATELSSLPLAPPWLRGMMNWRSRPVPIVSFDYLLGNDMPPVNARSKIVVFYPLEGRNPWEFFGIVSSAEPQPRTFHDADALANAVENKNPYIAMAVQLDKLQVGIPDLAVLKNLFFPR